MQARFATEAMGTRFELVLEHDDARTARAAAESALERVLECDARLSAFRSEALIARVNRAAAERPVRLDAETFALLRTCQELGAATEGAFDVALGGWMRRHGFHPGLPPAEGAPGGAFVLDAATWSVRFTRPGTRLDLGAIGKGHALELAAEELRDAGIERALLHGGTSSVVALGAPRGARGWRVRLGRAADGPTVWLRDRALSFSAPHGRSLEQDGERLGHLLDPRDGRPLPLGASCAVVATSARVAEAWSTALLVLHARAALEGRLEAWSPRLDADAAAWIDAPACTPARRTLGDSTSVFHFEDETAILSP